MELRLDLPFGERDMGQTVDVRKTLASFFEEQDRLPESKSALEQAGFVDNVQARVQFPGCLLIFA